MQISFVIPVFNQLVHTKACCEALESHVPSLITHEVIWINDGSENDTREYLDSLTGIHRVTHQPQNQGFATAINTGAAIAQGKWLCLLNNDVEVAHGAIAEMLHVAGNHREAGIIGNVQISTHDGSVDHTGIEFIDGGYPVHQHIDLKTLQAGPRARLVPAVTAACCLVDRKWFINAGGLDTRYRNGFEDVDLCMRAREAGWKIYVANHSIVKHAVSASQGRGRYEYRNAKKFLERWGPRTAAIEQATRLEEARLQRVQQAKAAPRSAHPYVDSVRSRVLERDDANARKRSTPPTIWVDLLRMEPRGVNGGIKPLVFGFLEEMGQLTWEPMKFVVLVQEGLENELTFLRPTDVIALRSKTDWTVREGPGEKRSVSVIELDAAFPPDALYCPFGTSVFARGDLPSVALLVDSLHRDLPAALPIEEVNFREDNFKRSIGSA
ncbi:MAG: glycosyltransferase family 2 protein, partial [Opitutaceae bacterium]|nr:glycosyltransferase family 2 protein [Opitutaceae bacterium]